MSNASPDKRCESWCGSTECVHPRSCKQTSLSHVAPINVPVAQTVEHGPAVTATFQPAPEVAGSIPAGDAPPEARQTVPVPNPPSTVSPCAPHNVVGCDRCAAFYWQAMYENACVEMEQTTPSTTPQKPGETPRTDALSVKLHDLTGGFKSIDLWDHARQLERELAEVRGAFRRSDAENDELRQENGALSAASATPCSAYPMASAEALLFEAKGLLALVSGALIKEAGATEDANPEEWALLGLCIQNADCYEATIKEPDTVTIWQRVTNFLNRERPSLETMRAADGGKETGET